MKNYLCLTFALLVCAATANRAADGPSITPVDAGLAGGLLEVMNNFNGDQTDPHVSGNLVAYTDFSFDNPGTIRYFDLLTGIDSPISLDEALSDAHLSVEGTRIAFSRTLSDQVATFLLDTATGTLTHVDPQEGSLRLATAIGGSRVAWVDGNSGNGDIVVHDLDSNDTMNLSGGIGTNGSPNIAPDGNAVAWESCNIARTQCDVWAAHWAPPGVWPSGRVNETSGDLNRNPDTDGTSLVYQSDRPSATDQDIYIVAGGVEQRLALPGIQRNPGIDQGVVSFESQQPGSTAYDVFVYLIETNTLYQVTATPGFDESGSDVGVLPNGNVRVVWAANDGPGGEKNVYLNTFTPFGVLAIDNVSAAEGDGGTSPFTFTVSLVPATTFAVTVDYTTADADAVAGGDYVATSGTLTFTPGETSKTFTVDVNGDTDVEGDETFTVVLSNPSHAVVSVNRGVATGTIENDDASDTTPPLVQSIVRRDPSPTNANSVSWTVTFTEPVTGVDATDFLLVPIGVSGASISDVTGSSSLYTVTANTGVGNGTLGLNLADDDSIADGADNALGANGSGNGDFIGEEYTIDRVAPAYNVCLLYDPLVAKKAGTAYKIKLQLCDASGNNLSSASIPVHAVGVTRTSNSAPGPLDDTGNANPDSDFRYDPTIEGYAFNLSLKCLGGVCFSTGTYTLNFTVGLDPTRLSAGFAVK